MACSESDDPTEPEPGENPADTTAPLVTGFSLDEGAIDVALDDTIHIEFSEAMDTAGAGAVTLSDGNVADTAWSEGNTVLSVTLGGQAEGEHVTLTVGTGLTDVAGNALPESFALSFYTHSSVPVGLDEDLHGDPAAVPRNVEPLVLFSDEMNLQSVYDATTIADGSKTIPEFQIGTVASDYRRITIRFLTPLDAETTYTVTIGTEALTQGGVNISAPVVFSFTTTASSDETPPQLVSTVPAQGSTSARTLDRVILNFSEPINPDTLEPDTLALFFHLHAPAEPVWNAAGDQVTVFLDGALPAGVDLFASFAPGTIEDWAGNGNDEAIIARFSIEGTPSFFPVNEDLVYRFGFEAEGEDEMGDWSHDGHLRMTYDAGTGGDFERIIYREMEGGVLEEEQHWLMNLSSSGVTLQAMEEDEGTLTFNPAVDYLPLPFQDEWMDQAQMVGAGETLYVGVVGELYEGPETIYFFDDDDMRLAVEGVYTLWLSHFLYEDEAMDILQSEGNDEIYFAPGLGPIAWYSQSYEYEQGIQIENHIEEVWLEEILPREETP